MKKALIFLLIGGVLATAAAAKLEFSAPYVGRAEYRYVEVGATGTVNVIYTNNTGAAVNVDAAKLYIDYESNILEQASIAVTQANSANFVVSENNVATPGSIRYQLKTDPASGKVPLAVAAGASKTLATISFHVNQGATVGSETYYIRFTMTDRVNNVSVVQSGTAVTGSIVDPVDATDTTIHLEASKVPNFVGLNTAADTTKGNTVSLGWAANEAAANDKKENAETIYASGTKLRYNLYRSEASGTLGSKVNGSAINASAYTNGPDTGIPGTAMEQLSDCTTYYFTAHGLDDCLPTRNEEANTTQLSATPHDYTAPGAPTGMAIAAADKKLTISWTNPGAPDLGGVILLRKETGMPAPTFSNASGNSDGTPAPAVGANPPGDANAVVIYKGTGTSYVDNGLTNGKVYYYALYAYDRAVAGPPREQGNNWSAATQKSAAPGVAPTALKNFLSLASSSGLAFRWNNPPEAFFGGALIIGTTSLGAWADLTTTSHLDNPAIAKMVLNQPGPTPAEAGLLTEAPLANFAGETLDTTGGTIYYFKAFAYNAGTALDPTSAASIAGHQFSGGVLSGGRVVPGGSGSMTFPLKASATDKLIVNSITIPSGLKEATGATVTNASQLINVINAKAGKSVVIVVGKWDRTTGTALGWTPAGEGTDFLVTAGEGYQVFVNEDFTLTLP